MTDAEEHGRKEPESLGALRLMYLDENSLDRAKRRLIEMHYRARVGHLGGNLSCIDAMMLVHHEMMRQQDRFVLSKGHSAGALYVTLWSLGLLSDQDLDSFHRDDTMLGGHPPPRGIPDILFGTGSLGHGLSLASGLALAARLQRADRRVFCLTSDGEWQEGSTLEAVIFASHQRLENLVIMVDHNGLQGFGTTKAVASMSPLHDRLSGLDLDIRVCDGHDLDSMRDALAPGCGKPVLAVLNTVKGHGVHEIEGKMESHYLPLTAEQYANAMASFEVAI
ncbi:MAG TPA: transketolase [Roseiarcus sp.]|jgi:transketolase